jgi:hypothetical protein
MVIKFFKLKLGNHCDNGDTNPTKVALKCLSASSF